MDRICMYHDIDYGRMSQRRADRLFVTRVLDALRRGTLTMSEVPAAVTTAIGFQLKASLDL